MVAQNLRSGAYDHYFLLSVQSAVACRAGHAFLAPGDAAYVYTLEKTPYRSSTIADDIMGRCDTCGIPVPIPADDLWDGIKPTSTPPPPDDIPKVFALSPPFGGQPD